MISLIKRHLLKYSPTNPVLLTILNWVVRKHKVRIKADEDHVALVKDTRCIRINPRHWVYVPTLAGMFDIYFKQVVPDKENGFLTVDYSGPKIHRLTRSGIDMEMASFPEEEEFIEDYFQWYRPRQGDLVFDLGAHCGCSAWHIAKKVGGQGKVIAFEPDGLNYAILLRNIERLNLDNVVAVRAAISDTIGKETFYAEGTIGSTLAKNSSRDTVGEAQTVETLTIEEACRRYGIPQFIKIDIEGAELDVIKQARDFLAVNRIPLGIDTNHWVGGALTNSRIESLLGASGYETRSSGQTGAMMTWARIVSASEQHPGDF